MQVLLAPHLTKPCLEGLSGSDRLTTFRKEQKKVLRDLWLLLHPDQLHNNPSYNSLTESQKKQLKDLWHTAMQIRPEEVGFQKNQIGYAYRSLPLLQDVLATAKTILEHAGIDTDTRYLIKGDTIDEQLGWLQNEINRLELESAQVQAELKILLEDQALLEKTFLISCLPEQQDAVKVEMLKHAEMIGKKADEQEGYLKKLLRMEAAE